MTPDQQRIVQQLVRRVYDMQAINHPCGSTLAMIRQEWGDEVFHEVKVALGIEEVRKAVQDG